MAQPFDHPYLKTLMTLDAVACGNRDAISYDDMQAMGYGPVVGDIILKSGPKQFTGEWALTLDYTMRGIADYNMEVRFNEAPSRPGLIMERLEQLDFNSVVLDTRDLGYNPRRMKFCAEQLDMEPDAYQRQHLRSLRSYFKQRSIILDQGTLQAYEQGLHRGARLRLQVQPKPNFAIDDLGFYKPQDYFELLGIRLSANNRESTKTSAEAVAIKPPTEKSPVPESATTTVKPGRAKASVSQWSELEQLMHEDIYVYTSSGGKHRGRLEDINEQLLVLKKQVGAGSMSYTIDRRRFARAQSAN